MNLKLIGRDRMEPSILRQELRPWKDEDAERVRPLVRAILAASGRGGWSHERFQWETSVYPLYYFAKEGDESGRKVYDRILSWAEIVPADDTGEPPIRTMLSAVADAEIDLLVESARYFMFIEAKIPKPGQKVRFHRNKKEYGAVHQLVRQFVQGQILSGQIGKEFMLATLGASDDGKIQATLNDDERRLMNAVGAPEEASLTVADFPWGLIGDGIGGPLGV